MSSCSNHASQASFGDILSSPCRRGHWLPCVAPAVAIARAPKRGGGGAGQPKPQSPCSHDELATAPTRSHGQSLALLVPTHAPGGAHYNAPLGIPRAGCQTNLPNLATRSLLPLVSLQKSHPPKYPVIAGGSTGSRHRGRLVVREGY